MIPERKPVVILIIGDTAAAGITAAELGRLTDNTGAAAITATSPNAAREDVREWLPVLIRADRRRGRYWESPKFQFRKRR